MKKQVLIINFILISFIGFGQEIKGIIIDSNKEPIFGASVYFNGTTKGTISKNDGSFSIEIPNDTSIPLVISFLGFETVYITNYISQPKPLEIQLNESKQVLDQVLIETDPWSREKKYGSLEVLFWEPHLPL